MDLDFYVAGAAFKLMSQGREFFPAAEVDYEAQREDVDGTRQALMGFVEMGLFQVLYQIISPSGENVSKLIYSLDELPKQATDSKGKTFDVTPGLLTPWFGLVKLPVASVADQD